jgi:catechol 2,3-dioxygenase-like lactoylglutathione lyase family enzyme
VAVKRIVANVEAADLARAHAFYADVLGMEVAMDLGWIVTFASAHRSRAQVSIMSEGGSGTPVPDLSVEVDDLDEIRRRGLAAGFPIEYGPVTEPWGVRRFFVRDPFGRLLNILDHEP